MAPCKRQLILFLIVVICGNTSLFLPISSVFANDLLPTSVEIVISCGDGFAEQVSGEVCDPGIPPAIPEDIGTTTCQDFTDIFGDPFDSGEIDCLSDCTGFNINGCYTCGNTDKEPIEACDTGDFGNSTCISLGFDGGSLFCTEDCQINTANCEAMEDPTGTPGGGGTGGAPGGPTGYYPGALNEQETKVVIMGKSYPDADVHILVDGVVTGIVKTDTKADFYFETTEIPSGVASFGFWSEDALGLKSTLLSLTFRVTLGAVTTITGVYLAPTIDVDKKSVIQGNNITIFGQTAPKTEVHIHINSAEEIIEKTNSLDTGNWELVFNTSPLDVDFHTAKALFQIQAGGNIIKSGFSKTVSFAISKRGGEAVCAEADLNGDGRVNLTDFSILLFYWGTDNECADQNQNGIVDLIDFSIMMYYWTG